MNRRQFLRTSTKLAAAIAVAATSGDCEASSIGALRLSTRILNHRLGYAPGANVEIVRHGVTDGPFRTDSAGRFSRGMLGLPSFKIKVFYHDRTDGRRYYGELTTSFTGGIQNQTVTLRRI